MTLTPHGRIVGRRMPLVRRVTDRPARTFLRAGTIGLATVALLAIAGCGGGPDGSYRRGTTTYNPGHVAVQQPSFEHEPERSFAGLRVAGFDSDIDPFYWDGQLMRDASNLLQVFEEFETRYQDVIVYQAEAADPILRRFRVWARRRGFESDFLQFWAER